MKKYLPINILVLSIIAFLGVMFLPKMEDLLATKVDKTSKEFAHYETTLKKINTKSDENKEVLGSQLQTGLVIINFWASWCTPCLEEFPSLIELSKKYSGKMNIVAINSDEESDLKNVKKIKDKFQFNFPNILDPKGIISNDFMVSAIPVSIIYFNGKVIEVSKGAKDFVSEEFLERIKLLK